MTINVFLFHTGVLINTRYMAIFADQDDIKVIAEFLKFHYPNQHYHTLRERERERERERDAKFMEMIGVGSK